MPHMQVANRIEIATLLKALINSLNLGLGPIYEDLDQFALLPASSPLSSSEDVVTLLVVDWWIIHHRRKYIQYLPVRQWTVPPTGGVNGESLKIASAYRHYRRRYHDMA